MSAIDLNLVFTALAVSLLVSALAYWRRWLAPSGVVGALIVGTLTLGFGGWAWGALLGVFFVSSSLLSKFRDDRKLALAAEKFDKGSRRDFGQAMANGGLGSLIALTHPFLTVETAAVPVSAAFALFIGVMATVTADTWATEIGTLSRWDPRLITTGRRVERGTSGGVTPLGTAASLAGGLLIGAVAGAATPAVWWHLTLLGGAGGLAGSLVDSLLGATVQAIYYSDRRRKETEKRVERDGTPNRHLRGWRWLNNDLVNLISSAMGGVVALAGQVIMSS